MVGCAKNWSAVNLEPDLLGQRHHLDDQDRVAAQFEEIVVHADRLAAQHVGPDPAQARLDVIGRCDVRGFARHGRQLQRGERLAVGLAVRRQRQALERHDRRRHHELGQSFLQVFPQTGDAGRSRRDAGHQLPVLRRVFAHEHDCVGDAGVLPQRRLDLARFDPVAANLHLRVAPAGDFQVAVRQPDAEVAGAIEARARVERVVDERGGRQVVPADVAARQCDAGHADLARAALGGQCPLLVEQVQVRVVDRAAHRQAGP